MNQQQKKKLAKLVDKMQNQMEQIREYKDELDEWLYERSEEYQASEKGDQMTDDIWSISDFCDTIENAIDELDSNCELEPYRNV